MRLALLFLIACGPPAALSGTATKLPAVQQLAVDTTPKERRRMMPPEVYLRAYLGWFGGLVPLDVQQRARPKGLFDAWDDYLAALGLPEYKTDLPRQTQSNTLMLATLGRLGEALCVRAAEHDLHQNAQPRVLYKFDSADFAARFDVLHRRFLGYPARLAPPDRIARFEALYRSVAERHGGKKQPLTADETAWAAVCAGLVQHPEAEFY